MVAGFVWMLTGWSSPPLLAGTGSLCGLMVILLHRAHRRELRERDVAEELLSASEARYRKLFGELPAGVCLCSAKGALLDANAAMLRMLGCASINELRQTDVVARLLSDGSAAQNRETSLLHKDGSEVITLVDSRTVAAEDGVGARIEYFLVPVTALVRSRADLARAIEAAEKAHLRLQAQSRLLLDQCFELAEMRDQAIESAHLKTEFLAQLGREIRHPLNDVVSAASFLNDTQLLGDQREMVASASESARQILTALADILDYSRIESGNLELESEAFSLRNALDEVIDRVAGSAETRGLELTCFVHPNTPDAFVGDRNRLNQVLTTLVDNASKFTEFGEISIRVLTLAETPAEVVVQFEVEDSGAGIPPEYLGKFFEPFTAVPSPSRVPSSGVRLALTRLLVERMGGQITLESESGQGTVFRFTLRLARPRELGHLGMPPEPDLSGRRVLLADDSAASRGVLASWLTAWGADVSPVADGDAAFAEIRRAAEVRRAFDLVLLDHQMPGAAAADIAEAATSAGAGASVVLLVPHSLRAWRHEPLVEGVAAVVSKPVREYELRRTLQLASLTEARAFGAGR